MPLYPFAVEQLDLTSYDLVITSDSGPMKGVITREDAVHICYCHSPMRYLWDGYHAYIAGMGLLTRIPFAMFAHYVRNWDYLAAQRVTRFVANSRYVSRRIRHYYGRESSVVHPPVEIERGYLGQSPGDYYLAVGRLVHYKRTDLAIRACNQLGRPLHIVGEGPELRAARAIAGPTIKFLGHLGVEDLWEQYANCRALLFSADEDFGIVPVEAQACGRPVIAFGKGGSLETVSGLNGEVEALHPYPATGIFFDRQTPESLAAAMLRFESQEESFSPVAIQHHARRFSTEAFIEQMTRILRETLPEPPALMQTPAEQLGESAVGLAA